MPRQARHEGGVNQGAGRGSVVGRKQPVPLLGRGRADIGWDQVRARAPSPGCPRRLGLGEDDLIDCRPVLVDAGDAGLGKDYRNISNRTRACQIARPPAIPHPKQVSRAII
jgi:hypothetical protein